jgi:DNA-binding NarL/FixJ family response regulator
MRSATLMVNSIGVVTRCLIVDDSRRFIDAARVLLERQGLQVVGEATNSNEALDLCRRLAPDVILLDVDLGEESGFDVARRLETTQPGAPVILISTHTELDYHDLIAASPVRGFLHKTDLSATAIRGLLGETV